MRGHLLKHIEAVRQASRQAGTQAGRRYTMRLQWRPRHARFSVPSTWSTFPRAPRSFSSGQYAVVYTVSVIAVLLGMCPSVITDKTINWVCGLYTFIAVVSYQNITLQMMYANVFSFGLSMSRLQVVVVVICNVLHTVVWACWYCLGVDG